MASRRLDISSLLCETQGAADNSSSPPRGSTNGQPSPQHPVRPYASSEHRAYVDAYNSVPAEQQSHRRQQQQRRVPSSSDAGGSLRPLALPLSIQSAPARRRTPSPPISPFRPSSPTRRSALHDRQVEDGNGRLAIGEFPRLGVAQPYATPLQYSPPLPPPPPPPPLSPSAHIYIDSRLERRTALQFQVNSYKYSPLQQTRLIPPSSPSGVSPISSLLPSVSPQTVPYSARPFTSVGGSGQTSADLFRLQDAGSHRSVSLSPTAPMSAPLSAISGLDVLVQAATEERERIDGNRRLSGGEDPQRSVNLSARSLPLNLSPVSFRSDTQQLLSSVPPQSPSTYASVYHSADHGDAFHSGQGLGEGGRPIKRRRSSPEPSTEQNRSPHIQATGNEMFIDTSFPRAVVVAHEQFPMDAKDTTFERAMHSPKAASHILHPPLAKHGSKYGAMSSSQGTRVDLEANTSPRSTVAAEPVARPVPVSVSGRRSPPRSKPRPKKPGSAALAVMEKGLREVVLSENEHIDGLGVGKDSSQRHTLDPGPSKGIRHASKQVKSLEGISKSLPSNKEVAMDDEQDVDEFFLSAFDSPRSGGGRASPQGRTVDKEEIIRMKDEKHPPLSRKNHEIIKRSTSAHLAHFSSKSRSLSPSAAENTSDHYLPTIFQDNSGGVPEHTADVIKADSELLEELAEAAGAATSDDDRTDFDDQETDAMEVDVETELLSLIDGPPEPTSKLYHAGPSISHIHGLHAASQSREESADFDRMSMPPPDVSKAIGAPAKEAKKGPSKAKAKSKADNADGARLSSKTMTKPGDMTAKAPKAKLKTRSRPPKGVVLEMHKTTKSGKEPQTPVSATLPAFHASASIPTDESFPVVTSSGRMVTKSKKSAAAAAAAAATSSGQTFPNGKKKSTGVLGSGDGNSSRSRSHSAMPRTSVDPETHREKSIKNDDEKHKDAEEPTADDDDKLYCICKTKYDEDRVMIACDRCDEWYHTQCVNMPDLEVDLVDQFVCPNCVARNPGLQLCTTYKQRCFSGLSHHLPNSPEACHKPSRGAYSKYCSDECGVKHLHRKIQAWASKGGSVFGLWETVKDTKRREGFVIREPGRTLPKKIIAELQSECKVDLVNDTEHKHLVDMSLVPQETKDNIIERLEARLQSIVREREARKREMEVIIWRERLLRSASDRAESVHECGWDQRLCFGDEEWMEFGEGVLESYEELMPDDHNRADKADERIDMEVDGQVADGEWWCRGKKKCDRHAGWQKLRAAEIKAEREGKEETLVKLTTREREIRSRIEDIRHPQSRSTTSGPTLNFLFLPNGSEDVVKKGKKKTNAVA